MGLDRKSCVVGAIGTSFDIAKGIGTTRLTR
jgi:hypothetical protein